MAASSGVKLTAHLSISLGVAGAERRSEVGTVDVDMMLPCSMSGAEDEVEIHPQVDVLMQQIEYACEQFREALAPLAPRGA